MPRYFTLMKKTEPDKAVEFVEIDKEICELIGKPVDEIKYAYSWYDNIGTAICCGATLEGILEQTTTYMNEGPQREGDYFTHIIAQYLETNYVSNAWWAGR